MEKTIIVNDVLNNPNLNGLRVISGKTGLNRTVGYVTVMEVPDVIRWLKGQDFVITSFYAIKDDVDAQCNVIKSLAENGCAALALKTGQYIKKVDDRVIELSEKLSFPLLNIPYKMTYIDIITQVGSLIFRDTDSKRIIESYLKDVLVSDNVDESHLVQKGLLLGLDVDTHYFCAYTFQYNQLYERKNNEVKILDELAKIPKMYSDENTVVKIIHKISYENNQTIFFSAKCKNRLEEFMDFAVSLFKLPLKALKGEVKLSIGEPSKGLKGLKKSYYNSISALKSGSMFFNNETTYRYSDLELYTDLEKILGKQAGKSLEIIAKKIGSQDILNTLCAYFEHNGNIDAVAKSIFVHRNTVTYRIKRIYELTELSIKNSKDYFKLYLLSLYHKSNYTNTDR